MTTPPAVYGQFGQTLAFTERTLTVILHDHLAQRGIEPGIWYALKLITMREPGPSRPDLRRDLEDSPNLAATEVPGLLDRLETDGLISGEASVGLTAKGEAFYQSLREYVVGPTVRLLGQFDPDDIETTVRTMQAITTRAAEEAAAAAPQPG